MVMQGCGLTPSGAWDTALGKQLVKSLVLASNVGLAAGLSTCTLVLIRAQRPPYSRLDLAPRACERMRKVLLLVFIHGFKVSSRIAVYSVAADRKGW
jgi:hypothetical protein